MSYNVGDSMHVQKLDHALALIRKGCHRYALKLIALTIAEGSFSSSAIANDRIFIGMFEGAGRACSGALYVRVKTIQ